MVSKFTLLSSLLLASAALASPLTPSRHEVRLARRSEQFQSTLGGVSLSRQAETFDTVKGTFNVPVLPLNERNSQIIIMLGIDSVTCSLGGCIQAGILTYVSPQKGELNYNGWCSWGDDIQSFDNSKMTIVGGDIINVTVTAFSATSGIAILDNTNTGQTISYTFNSELPLAQKEATWAAQASDDYPLANFDTVLFSNAVARNNISGAHYYPSDSGAKILKIQGQNGSVYSSVTTGGSYVSITYV